MHASAGNGHVSTRVPNNSLLPSPQQLARNAARVGDAA